MPNPKLSNEQIEEICARLSAKDTEEGHQTAFVQWCKLHEEQYPGLDTIFAIPNGGKRDAREAGRMKLAGIRVGVLDLFLPVPQGDHNGLWIEFKRPSLRPKSGRAAEGKVPADGEPVGGLSAAQLEFARKMYARAYCVRIAYCWQDAVGFVRQYYGK